MSKLVRPRDKVTPPRPDESPRSDEKLTRPSEATKSPALLAFEQGEVRLCVRVPEPLYRELKSKLGAQGMKLQGYVLALLEADLRKTP